MEKEKLKELLKLCFGKEKNERYHAIAMLIIWGIFIGIVVLILRLSPPAETDSTLESTTDTNQSQSGNQNQEGNVTDQIIDQESENTPTTETYEINYSYLFTITDNGKRTLITGKKLDNKEIFTIIDDTGSQEYAKLSGNYLLKENGEYRIIDQPNSNLIYTDMETIIELTEHGTLSKTENTYTYQIPTTKILSYYHPELDITTIDNSLSDTIILETENNTLKKITANFNNYSTTINNQISTLTITVELSNVGTTEDFTITLN